ncbi:hypothetical protein EV360DRAFT_90547 [Lentinula raphanica]|nr:hypothetical protein EV360DRAFT_90547 [Lentinula raphanica]
MNPKHPYDRIELRSPSKPISLDRRLLRSPGAIRTPRAAQQAIHRSSPYHRDRRSLSPDPKFLSTSFAPLTGQSERGTNATDARSGIPPSLSRKSVRFAEVQRHTSNPLDDARVEDDKIPKPPGEVGQPSKGGYNLRIRLEWSDSRFDEVETFINTTVEKKLDRGRSFDKQSLSKIHEVQKMALKKYPFLNEYHRIWVIDDFIKCHLKRWNDSSSQD